MDAMATSTRDIGCPDGEPSDEALVLSVRQGDTSSLGVLVRRWEGPLFRFVFRLIQRHDDAQDVCQETFLRVLRRADRFREGSRFSTWMYQIALNLCRDRRRRDRRWSRVVVDHELDESTAPVHDFRGGSGPERNAERREAQDRVRRAMDSIPREQREVLILKEFEGLRFREIARILDCPESTVKSRMYYGLRGLKEAMSRDERRGVSTPPDRRENG
jgi:RNA polymerase sigma-70 factor (ECF subfamily)